MAITTVLKSVGTITGLFAFQAVPTAMTILSIGFAFALGAWGIAQVMNSYSNIIKARKGRQ
jgi:hypothetical protein